MSDIGENLAFGIENRFKEGVRIVVSATGKGLKNIVSEAAEAAINKIKYENGTLTEMKPVEFTKRYHTRALDTVKIPDKDVLAFKKELVRHGVDFTILADKNNLDEFGKPKEWEFLFMGSNINQIRQSLEKVLGEFAKKLVSEHKPLESVQLKDALEKVNLQSERLHEHEVSGRGAR